MCGIDDLRKITKELPSLDQILSNNMSMVEYRVEQGTCYGFPTYRDDRISIQRMFLSQGTVFPRHSHDESIEFYIVYKGNIEHFIYNTGEKINLVPSSCMKIAPKVEHSLTALEDSELVVIKIPPDEKYVAG